MASHQVRGYSPSPSPSSSPSLLPCMPSPSPTKWNSNPDFRSSRTRVTTSLAVCLTASYTRLAPFTKSRRQQIALITNDSRRILKTLRFYRKQLQVLNVIRCKSATYNIEVARKELLSGYSSLDFRFHLVLQMSKLVQHIATWVPIFGEWRHCNSPHFKDVYRDVSDEKAFYCHAFDMSGQTTNVRTRKRNEIVTAEHCSQKLLRSTITVSSVALRAAASAAKETLSLKQPN